MALLTRTVGLGTVHEHCTADVPPFPPPPPPPALSFFLVTFKPRGFGAAEEKIESIGAARR